jgi:hypothetical protein
MEKTLDQKIKECKILYIQNIEKTITNDMIFKFLKDQKISGDVKSHSINSKDGYIKLEFHEHEKARQYYERANFKEKILIRPFNIYFNLQLHEN